MKAVDDLGEKRHVKVSTLNNLVFNYYFIDNNSSQTLLIISGWQSYKNIFNDLIKDLKCNVIIFDLPGLGGNTYEKSLYKKSQIILSEFIDIILDKYTIKHILGTSASTSYLLTNNVKLDADVTLILMSPQLSISLIDKILDVVYKVLLYLENTTNLNIYKTFININIVRNYWAHIVAGTKNDKAFRAVIMGINQVKKYWTLQQYMDLMSNKHKLVYNLAISDTRNKVVFIVGKNDQLLDYPNVKSIVKNSLNNRFDILELDGGHVLELNAPTEVADIINSLM